MKKLNKLQINREKIIRNEELVLLRGGYSATDPCPGVACGTDEDCCPSNPDCIYIPIIYKNVCCSPGGGDD